MKRNMDIVRDILLKHENGEDFDEKSLNTDQETFQFHLGLMIKEDLLEGELINTLSSSLPLVLLEKNLTPRGHDFADLVRSQIDWDTLKQTCPNHEISGSIEEVSQWLREIRIAARKKRVPSMQPQNRKTVFLSHKAADKDITKQFKDFLLSGYNKSGGIHIFQSSDDGIDAGDDPLQTIKNGIQKASIVITLCTPNYLNESDWLIFETAAAWGKDIKACLLYFPELSEISDIPSPCRNYLQAKAATNPDELQAVINKINEVCNVRFTPSTSEMVTKFKEWSKTQTSFTKKETRNNNYKINEKMRYLHYREKEELLRLQKKGFIDVKYCPEHISAESVQKSLHKLGLIEITHDTVKRHDQTVHSITVEIPFETRRFLIDNPDFLDD